MPLASGAFSMRTGYAIIIVSVLISLALYLGKYMLLTVLLSLILGTAYSLPPFRLKRFYFWAAFCIIAVRGLIVNLLLFLHFHFNLNGQQDIPTIVWLLTATIFVYSIVIAWFKDIPDMAGDRQFNIKTLTLRWGAKQVFFIGNGLISLGYLGLAIAPFVLNLSINKSLFSIAHLVFLVALWLAIAKTKLQSQASVRQFYLFIWILFFLEYATFAAVCF
ncbi:MAG: homogentisate phytyltransferase [Saprospiraceae bacterium]|nr:homogentisate phytyltransferase [Saprospiraceae bacterium]